MDLKPVKHADKPRYPVKEEISAEKIKVSIPKRWAQSAAVKVTLGTLAAMSLAGCTNTPATGESASPRLTSEETVAISPIITDITEGIAAPMTITVAPLFIHGEGRGAFGCVMVAPPVFLSEDDALSVINEVAKEYGLVFSSENSPTIWGVQQPVTNLNPVMEETVSEPKEPPEKIIDIIADYADKTHGVAIEFVSVEDVKAWKQRPAGASVELYDTKDAAAQLSEAFEEAAISETSLYTAGVLYDPCEFSEESEAQTYTQSSAQLKAQARDFFEWLKSEGII